MKNKHAMVDNFGLKNVNMHTRKYRKNEKEALLSFMSGCEISAVGGLVIDAVSKEMLHIENLAYKKDDFLFNEMDIYHLKKYDAAVTDEFYDHVMKAYNEDKK